MIEKHIFCEDVEEEGKSRTMLFFKKECKEENRWKSQWELY